MVVSSDNKNFEFTGMPRTVVEKTPIKPQL